MKKTVKNISDTKIKMTITLGNEELAVAEEVAVLKLSKDVNVAGFRKGKTPKSVAAKNIDPNALQEETLNNAISKSVSECFLEDKIQALDRPEVVVTKFVPGESLEFTAEVEILPKVTLGDYKKLKVSKDKVEVKTAEIDDVINRMKKSFADKKEAKRAAKLGDETVIDFVGKLDGVAFDGGTGKDYTLELGSNQFIPGFEDAIVGHKTGEEFDIDLAFPKDYHAKNLAGKKVVFTVTLKQLKEITDPELNDDFAKKAGPFKTMTELKDDVKRELTSQKEREANEKFKDELVKKLTEISKVAVPEVLVSDQMRSIEQDFAQNLAYQGMTIDQYLEMKQIKSKEEWLESEVKTAATNRVKSSLVLAELSKVEKIEASEAELDSQIDSFKKQYANNAEFVKHFDKPEVRMDVANRILTEKTVERLVELNK